MNSFDKSKTMFFTVLPARSNPPIGVNNAAFLLSDQWSDWISDEIGRRVYQTQYDLVFVDTTDKKHYIGSVKIGQFDMPEEQNRPSIPDAFDSLDNLFFSIGQSEDYYQTLNNLGESVRNQILNGLNDLALKTELIDKAIHERVMKMSLLRDVSLEMIKGRFRRLARGDARLTPYKFSFELRHNLETEIHSPTLSFEVIPDSEPPTNLHIIIGRNGVGKTHYLTMMTKALTIDPNVNENTGFFIADNSNEDSGLFANLISVSFSAFDAFDSLPLPDIRNNGIKFSYIGLKEINKDKSSWSSTLKGTNKLTEEFVNSVSACHKGGRILRWRRALQMLNSDPLFKENDIATLADDDKNWRKRGIKLFSKLSSGHKIVLLTITRLIESVVERTLILIDEPEAHLHPPLLSAFIRVLSDLLIQQNGVAIIATHSPVVVQEVPRSCVWILRRIGAVSKAERPETETFGENVGVLTREIFGLEVTESGFHAMLQEAVDKEDDYDSVISNFNGQLGAEARSIVRALITSKKQNN